jgi:tetratricopeptide (TPR) repeat protein
MRTFPDIRMRGLVAGAQRAQDFLDRGNYREARDAFAEMRARARKLGFDSAYLAWGLAVATDYLGELEMAFTTIWESVAKDPLNPAAQRSFEIIADHIRSSLADASRAPDDPSTPRLYRLLLEAGEADVASHLAMARHLAHAGEHEAALRIVDAVTLLAPASRDAWLQKAAFARAAGEDSVADECEAQAATLATTSVPFGIPAVGGAASA